MIGSIARRYAKALFLLAGEESSLEQTGVELQQLADVASDPEMAAMLGNPLLSGQTRRTVAQTLADRLALRPTTRNFLCLLADHQRLRHIAGIAECYRRLLDAARGRVRAKVSSAVALNEEQEHNLVAAFERLTGKTVLATKQLDPELLGGVLVEIAGKVYDGSLKTQLQHLAASMAGSGGTHQ
jgi:F-type H+-transporting ATPase subunit delta